MMGQGLGGLEWLCGVWIGDPVDGEKWMRWTRNQDGSIEGSAHTSKEGKIVHREQMWLEARDQDIIYLFQQEGRARMEFRLTEHAPGDATFENLGRGYPARIRMWRSGNRLHARIDDIYGERPMDWSWSIQ